MGDGSERYLTARKIYDERDLDSASWVFPIEISKAKKGFVLPVESPIPFHDEVGQTAARIIRRLSDMGMLWRVEVTENSVRVTKHRCFSWGEVELKVQNIFYAVLLLPIIVASGTCPVGKVERQVMGYEEFLEDASGGLSSGD